MQPIIMPISEVADRYTIALLKLNRLTAEESEGANLREQVNHYKAGLDMDMPGLADLVDQLYELNGCIWDTEGTIRRGAEADLEDREIARLAIEVRNLNRTRCAIKNSIVLLTRDGFQEVKMNYAGS